MDLSTSVDLRPMRETSIWSGYELVKWNQTYSKFGLVKYSSTKITKTPVDIIQRNVTTI